MTTKLSQAIIYAATRHADQVRKYTGEPYVTHCIEVMMLVRKTGGSEDMQCAAMLHDTIEDCGVAWASIARKFGDDVADMVYALSDTEEGNRATRKRLSCERLASASGDVQTIKLADLISNTQSIAEHDPKFAETYFKEKVALLRSMTKGNATLWKKAVAIIPDKYWV